MTPEARIATSTMSLDKFERGGVASMANLMLIRDEMLALEAIAAQHHNLAADCNALIARWQRYVIRMKSGH